MMLQNYLKRTWPFLRLYALWVLLSFLHQEVNAQSTYGRFSVSGAIGNHTIGFPFQNLGAAIHPALSSLGLEFRLNKSVRHTLSLASNTAFIPNKAIGSSITFGTDIHYRFTIKSGAFVGINLGLGGLAQFYPRKTYSYDAQSGRFEAAGSKPKFASHVGGGLSIGYDFSQKHHKRYAVFLKNQFFIQSPYFDVASFPIMPQNLLQLGLNIKLNPLKKSSTPPQ